MASGCSRLLCACTEREEPAGPSSCDTRPHGDRDRRGRSRGHGGGRAVAASRSPHRGCFGSRGDGRAREHLPGVPCSTPRGRPRRRARRPRRARRSHRRDRGRARSRRSDRGRNLGRAPVGGHAAVGARRGRMPAADGSECIRCRRSPTSNRRSNILVHGGRRGRRRRRAVRRRAARRGPRRPAVPASRRAPRDLSRGGGVRVQLPRLGHGGRGAAPHRRRCARPIGVRSSRPPSRTWLYRARRCAHRARGARRRRHDRPQPRGAVRDRSVGRRRIRRDGAGRARPGGAERALGGARRAEVEEALGPWI